jgi:hypothetical protein
MIAKCPKCEKLISHIESRALPVKDGKLTWNGAVFVCPFCFSVLGAGIDPIAAKTDIVTELTAEIQQVKDDVKRLATRHP